MIVRLLAALAALVGALLGGASGATAADSPDGIEVVALLPSPTDAGYLVVGADGRVLAYGDAVARGSLAGVDLAAPIVTAMSTSTGDGYWLVASDGGVFAYGDAVFHGSAGSLRLNRPIVAASPTPTDAGYHLFAADGGVFAYGDAVFRGSTARLPLNAPIVGASLAVGGGYRLVAADGGVFSFDAAFFGSAGSLRLNRPVIAMRPTTSGNGYHLFAADGGVFAYGDAGFLGSGADLGVTFAAFASTAAGDGYWMITEEGYLQTFGAAPRLGAPRPGPPRREVPPTLEPVVVLSQPVAAVDGPDEALYVAERAGRVRRIVDSQAYEIVLDLTSLTSTASERGLLGLAFDPDGDWLYVSHTDLAGDLQIAAYPTSTVDGRVVVGSGRETLLEITQPFGNHNGGEIRVGPDGYLWIASGDGGSGGDPLGNGQRLDTLLGKLLRIDPTPGVGAGYRIPPDNPFVDRSDVRHEIWAYGLRNPWRFSFDSLTDELWIGDVGQGRREEINRVSPESAGGANFGWNRREGDLAFRGAPPVDHVGPVHVYDHSGGRCSVTGGVTYRGQALPALYGAYLFGDFCSGEIWALRDGGGLTVERLDLRVPRLVAFSDRSDGEVLLLSLDGGVFRLAGAPAP